MEFEVEAEHGDLGARVEDVVQEAIDSAARLHADRADLDADDLLRRELSSRGIKAPHDAWIRETAQAIRSGQRVRVGNPDGSVDPPDHHTT